MKHTNFYEEIDTFPPKVDLLDLFLIAATTATIIILIEYVIGADVLIEWLSEIIVKL